MSHSDNSLIADNVIIKTSSLSEAVKQVEKCRLCEPDLPLGPRPVVQLEESATILIVGQAPGRRVHETGIPWNDPSGDRLRAWLALSREQFYDPARIAIMPMGFCYPGTGPSGDLPPRKECAAQWHQPLLERLPQIKLTLLIGQYAQKYYLRELERTLGLKTSKPLSLTQRVQQWREYLPQYLPLPHPSPRNQIWLKKNAWFIEEVVPALRSRVQSLY